MGGRRQGLVHASEILILFPHAGKRRHPEPPDWTAIRRAMDAATGRRQGRMLARKIEVHVDTVRRWRRGLNLPAPGRIRPLIDALYAMRLYRANKSRL
jgi:hypothetical protein